MRVVATLTTRPEYKKNFRRCLDSIVCQFDEVYLGLPKISRKGVEYKNFEHPGVTIVTLEEDIGPASKILAGFIKEKEKEKDSLIVSVDDDNLYNKNLRISLEKQRLADIKNNKNRVITNAGHYIKYWNVGLFGLNGGGLSCPDRFYDINREVKLTKISGFGGVAFPSKVIPDIKDFIIFTKKTHILNSELITRDDITTSAYFSNKKIDIVLNPDRKNFIDHFFEPESEDINKERIIEDNKTIMKYSNQLKKYFKNNPNKTFTSFVLLDLIFIVTVMFLFIYIRYKHL